MNTVRDQLTKEQWAAVAATVRGNNPGMAVGTAGRIVDEGLKFVVACTRFPGAGLAPSRVVDEGWHGLILHTKVYADLCASLGAGFVHHFPGWDPMHYDPTVLDRTREKIRACGYDVDEALWGPPTGTPLVPVAANCQHSTECTIRPMPTPQPPCSQEVTGPALA